MARGKVKWFSEAKGYGFIQCQDVSKTGKDIFVHYSEILRNGFRMLEAGQIVEFEVSETPKGLQAKKVSPVS